MVELLGLHRYQLDGKGRIALPAKYREPFAEGVYLTLGQDGCPFAFPAPEWQRRSAEVRNRPLAGQRARAYARMFFANAERVDLDGQGRLLIPQKLRSQVGLDREAVVTGVYDRLDIWASEAWDRYQQLHAGSYTTGSLEPESREVTG